ncbi:YOR352W [Saccharomyces arboricola H-6]|uniref:YOR352W n=1 Tax=Saccharomyces arboricola (strain H-6 / AS 2.3317 / CBS 10644) TaxID=1160507 RepID=J8PHE3_SACAR|nr:YOR352W [Saccharomyces arboricola H-6]
MSEPTTPLHAQPNEQLDLDNLNDLDEKDIEDLNLDPNSDVEINVDFDGAPNSNIDDTIWQRNSNKKKRYHTPEFNDVYSKSNNAINDVTMLDDVDDFQPRINVCSPFSSITKLNELLSNNHNGTSHPRRLSMSQQSKFISYVDDQLLQIQRKFVQSRGLNIKTGYAGLTPLLRDLKTLIDFIWYSIAHVPNSDYLLQPEEKRDCSGICDSRNTCDYSSYFGQGSYLIKIADDLIDYVEKFTLKDMEDSEINDTLSKLFKLVFILDRMFVILIDNSNSKEGATTSSARNKLAGLNGTDTVRLKGIAERARVRLPIFLESQGVHGYHYELSKIYEGFLDSANSI